MNNFALCIEVKKRASMVGQSVCAYYVSGNTLDGQFFSWSAGGHIPSLSVFRCSRPIYIYIYWYFYFFLSPICFITCKKCRLLRASWWRDLFLTRFWYGYTRNSNEVLSVGASSAKFTRDRLRDGITNSSISKLITIVCPPPRVSTEFSSVSSSSLLPPTEYTNRPLLPPPTPCDDSAAHASLQCGETIYYNYE